MGPDSSEVPEPFRYSRAHSWPTDSIRVPQSPLKPPMSPQRRGLFVKLALAAFGLLVLGVVAVVVLSRPEPAPPPPPPPEILASVVPEPTSRVVPITPPARGTSKAKPTASRGGPAAAGPKAITGNLADYLLAVPDLAPVAPGSWGVSAENITKPASGPHPLVRCAEPRDFGKYLARYFLVPATPGPWQPGGPDVTQRLGKYPDGRGAAAVEGFRRTLAACPTRQRTGYTEQWSIVQDDRTSTGDVMVVRRLPQPQPPQGNNDFGTDFVVVRNRDVVSIVDFSRGAAPDDAQTRALVQAVRLKLCGPSC